MKILISRRAPKSKTHNRQVRVNERTHARLVKLKEHTGREFTEIVDLAIQQVRVGRGK